MMGEKVGMSRAAFANRIKELVGRLMFEYLTNIRIRPRLDSDAILDLQAGQKIAQNLVFAITVVFVIWSTKER